MFRANRFKSSSLSGLCQAGAYLDFLCNIFRSLKITYIQSTLQDFWIFLEDSSFQPCKAIFFPCHCQLWLYHCRSGSKSVCRFSLCCHHHALLWRWWCHGEEQSCKVNIKILIIFIQGSLKAGIKLERFYSHFHNFCRICI